MATITTGKHSLADIVINGITIKGSTWITSIAQSGDNVAIKYKLGWISLQGYFYMQVNDLDSSHFIPKPAGGRFNENVIFNAKTEFFFSKEFTLTVAQGASLSNVGFGIGWTGGTTGGGGTVGADAFAWSGNFPSGTTAPVYYTAPKNFSISVNSKTSTSVTVKASWTEGSKTSTVTASIGSNSVNISNGGTGTISGLTPNTSYSISGSLSDGTTSLSSSASVLTNIVGPSAWSSASSNTNSITVAATSSNGGNFKYQYRIQKSGSWSSWQDSGTFSSLSANTNYPLEARCVNTDNSTTSSSLSGSLWTYPVVNVPSLSRRSGSEHNTIDVSTSASVASSYDQFAFKLGNGGWSGWQAAKTYAYGSLSGNTSYTVYVKMKNTSSGYESSAQSASITTWHNPLTNLKVNLVNRWFWYLQTNCSYTYTGTISKFEFDIGGQGWQNKGTTNSHSRGSTTAGASGNLAYNTDHVCKVRVTDNHGRTYTAQATYKTLDERCLYVNGALREVKVIKPNNSVVYITPNLLTVVKPDGSTVNMNKIINNDLYSVF